MAWFHLRGIEGIRFRKSETGLVGCQLRQSRTWRGRKFNFWS